MRSGLFPLQEYNIELTERYQSRYNDSARFRASAALGDVLVRVARRAGIVVIFEKGLETKWFSNSVSVLKGRISCILSYPEPELPFK